MTAEHESGNIGGAANPKQGAGSGVTKTSSTTTSEGPVTTRATGQGDPIVKNDGSAAEVAPSPRPGDGDDSDSEDSSKKSSKKDKE